MIRTHNNHQWHLLQRTTRDLPGGGEEVIDVTAASQEDGIPMIVRWTRRDDHLKWSVHILDGEGLGWYLREDADYGMDDFVPDHPPEIFDDLAIPRPAPTFDPPMRAITLAEELNKVMCMNGFMDNWCLGPVMKRRHF